MAAVVWAGSGMPNAPYKALKSVLFADACGVRRLLNTTKAQAQAKETTTNLRINSFIVCSDDDLNTARLKLILPAINQSGEKLTAGSYRLKPPIDATRETVLVYFDQNG
jgi:hypothetical protein